ncbi:MAG: hypothetical protein NW200_08235 [Hyphomonadaceae bacterium]|nr:hypothetical protein [Hyphomonadaceae bacterium]
MKTLVLAALLLLPACATPPAQPTLPADVFFERLTSLCGQRFAGRLASTDAADADFAGKPLVIGPVDCAQEKTIRIPFAVGEDRSRTWVVTRLESGALRLKHDHRHADGSEDVLSQYGGDSSAPGADDRQDFPVDDYSKALFARESRTASMTNVWTMAVAPGALFAYELNRPNRHFRVEFDLSRPL